MSTRYLLPCQCGNKLEVEANQSGLEVPCSCGAKLTVPTMRGLAALERAEASPTAKGQPASTWGVRQGLVFLGSVIAIASLLAGLLLWTIRPLPPAVAPGFDEANRANIDTLNSDQLWDLWAELRLGPGDQALVGPMREYLYYEQQHEHWYWCAAGGGILGILLIVIGAIIQPQRLTPSQR